MEIIELVTDRPGDYDFARVAIDNQLVTPFEIPKSVRREQYPRESDFLAYVKRQAITLLAAYGDARERRTECSL